MLSILASLVLILPAPLQETTRVSVSDAEVEANGRCFFTMISADGRYVVWMSRATNLVPNDTNGAIDGFMHDRESRTTIRITEAPGGIQANGPSFDPHVNHDGRIVAFLSDADNLVPGDTNGKRDVFVRDLVAGTIQRVSVDSAGVQSDDHSYRVALSGDGNLVLFDSYASNLVPGDGNGHSDVFAHDLTTGITTCVSVDDLGQIGSGGILGSTDPAVSEDGRYVGFASDDVTLVANDGNGLADCFLHDRTLGRTIRISVDSLGNEAVGGRSVNTTVSHDGRYTAYQSQAINLVPGDTNGVTDVFLYDLLTGQTTCVSPGLAGAPANGGSYDAAITDDGFFVAYHSSASNMVAGDVNGQTDVFIHDWRTGVTECVSNGLAGAPGDSGSRSPQVNYDGRIVTFDSRATNLVTGDTNNQKDIFVHTRAPTGPTLTVTGSCPGMVTLDVSGATALGLIGFLSGARGYTSYRDLPCVGLAIDLEAAVLRSTLPVDANGSATTSLLVGPALCGTYIQTIDLSACRVGNLVRL